MQRADKILRNGSFVPALARDRVILDFDRRHRRRAVLSTQGKHEVLLDLPEATHIRDGDALVLADSSLVLVSAEPEPLLEITAANRDVLIRIAWHLGNRHLPTQLMGASLRIRADHVIAVMVRGLGGEATSILAAFDPEGGAYQSENLHSHAKDLFSHAASHHSVWPHA
jgi:urease accessory protein